MCRLCFWINLFHPGIVEVCVHPFFYLVLCFDSLCPLIVAHQCRRRNDHIATHKYSQDLGNDLAWSHRYFLDQARKKGIYFFEPYNCCDSPEKAIQKIDSSSKIKWQFTVIPKYFSEKDLCKYTAQIFISAAKKSACQKRKLSLRSLYLYKNQVTSASARPHTILNGPHTRLLLLIQYPIMIRQKTVSTISPKNAHSFQPLTYISTAKKLSAVLSLHNPQTVPVQCLHFQKPPHPFHTWGVLPFFLLQLDFFLAVPVLL